MSGHYVGHFIVVSGRRKAKGLVSALRHHSSQFKIHYANQDAKRMVETSAKAWKVMVQIFDVLRNEQDHQRLARNQTDLDTGFIATDVTLAERTAMILNKRLDKLHTRYRRMNLRDALNKIAHHNTECTTFRIDGRGAHYLILGGTHQGKHWVAEILVAKFCTNASAAVRALP